MERSWLLAAPFLQALVPQVIAGAELYDLAADTFTPTANMIVPRSAQTATLLRDGRVLVAGGDDGTTFLKTAELYDPSRGTFTATGNMTSARAYHTATLLNDGRVLIAGGFLSANSNVTLSTAELYDPTSGTFSPTGGMTSNRARFTASLLGDGKVLVAGGFDGLTGTPVASAELYDPTTGVFIATGSMVDATDGHTATVLNNGTVLVTGGNGGGLKAAELYDPSIATFSLTGSMASVRGGQLSCVLLSFLVASAQGRCSCFPHQCFSRGAYLFLVPASGFVV